MKVLRLIVVITFLAILAFSFRAHVHEGRPTQFIIRHPGGSLLETFYSPCWPNGGDFKYFQLADLTFWAFLGASLFLLIPKRNLH
jgi:hypothetical protein